MAEEMSEPRGDVFGLDAKAYELVIAIEALVRAAGYGGPKDTARVQQALGSVLWRRTARMNSFAMTESFIMDSITLRDGGRDARVEVRLLPPVSRGVETSDDCGECYGTGIAPGTFSLPCGACGGCQKRKGNGR